MTKKIKVWRTEKDDLGRSFLAFKWVTYGIRMSEGREDKR